MYNGGQSGSLLDCERLHLLDNLDQLARISLLLNYCIQRDIPLNLVKSSPSALKPPQYSTGASVHLSSSVFKRNLALDSHPLRELSQQER